MRDTIPITSRAQDQPSEQKLARLLLRHVMPLPGGTGNQYYIHVVDIKGITGHEANCVQQCSFYAGTGVVKRDDGNNGVYVLDHRKMEQAQGKSNRSCLGL